MTTKEEYAERRQKWLDAMRSGEIKQIIGELRTREGMCAQGVGEYARGAEWHTNSRGDFYAVGKCDQNGGRELCDVRMTTLGCEYYGITDNAASSLIVRMNDEDEMTFSQIADYIEAHPHEFWGEGTY